MLIVCKKCDSKYLNQNPCLTLKHEPFIKGWCEAIGEEQESFYVDLWLCALRVFVSDGK